MRALDLGKVLAELVDVVHRTSGCQRRTGSCRCCLRQPEADGLTYTLEGSWEGLCHGKFEVPAGRNRVLRAPVFTDSGLADQGGRDGVGNPTVPRLVGQRIYLVLIVRLV